MKNLLVITLCVALAFTTGIAVFLLSSSLRQPSKPVDLPPINVGDTRTDEDSSRLVPLYFLSAGQRSLVRERREVSLKGRLAERLETLVEELIAGPRLRNLLPTIPPGTQLLSVFWVKDQGCAVVNFSKEFIENNPGHVLAEWASIYSVVNTVADHDSAIRSVQILVDGELAESGALWDLSRPFAPDQTFVLYSPVESEEEYVR